MLSVCQVHKIIRKSDYIESYSSFKSYSFIYTFIVDVFPVFYAGEYYCTTQ